MSSNNNSVADERRSFIDGLHEVAWLVESVPELPVPSMSDREATWHEFFDAAEVDRLMDVLPGEFTEIPNPIEDSPYLRFESDVKLGQYALRVTTYERTYRAAKVVAS